MTAELEPGFEALPSPANDRRAPRRGRTKMLGIVGAVVAIAAGGTATYVAFASGGSGAQSPKAAVQQAVSDLEHSDLLGLLDDLAPNERAILTSAVHDDVASLKRLKVLSPKADPAAVSGVHVAAGDLTYAASTVRVNSRVELVSITGGTISLNADTASLPLTKQILGAANATTPKHVSASADLSGKGIRIAAEKVGDDWYASLFYTLADRAANGVVPTASDYIAAVGQSSADGAVDRLVRALASGDDTAAVQVISPNELAALHDYGDLAVQSTGGQTGGTVTIKTLQLTDTPISGGVRVGLHSVVLVVDGRTVSVTLTGACAQVTTEGYDKRICAADLAKEIVDTIATLTCFEASLSDDGAYGSNLTITPDDSTGSSTSDSDSGSGDYSGLNDGNTFTDGCADEPRPASAAQLQAVSHLVSAVTKIGVDTAKVGDKWLVTPVRTLADAGSTVYDQLTPGDLTQLASLTR